MSFPSDSCPDVSLTIITNDLGAAGLRLILSHMMLKMLPRLAALAQEAGLLVLPWASLRKTVS